MVHSDDGGLRRDGAWPRGSHYMFLNSDMKVRLTGSVSWRLRSLSVPRPESSRAIEAIAFMLTMVERGICLKTAGSSTSRSSRVGFRVSASPSPGLTTGDLFAARKD